MTSTDSKKGAALAANDIMSSAPMAKFGAMRTPTPAPDDRRGCVGELAAERLEARVVPAGRADDDVDATLDAVGDVGR